MPGGKSVAKGGSTYCCVGKGCTGGGGAVFCSGCVVVLATCL